MRALSDLSVVDLSTGVAGPFCTKLFAGFGADVVKVEPPCRDRSRQLGPFPGDGPDSEASGMFAYLNGGKLGTTLNIETAEGAAILAELVSGADVVVESFAPGYLSGLGLGYEFVKRQNPGVVVVSITPFGQSGPWRDYQATDLVEYAAAGLSYVNGSPEREPLKEPGPESSYQAGVCAFIGAMSALAHRDLTGEGQFVDISVLEAAASTFAPQFLGAMHSGRPVDRGTTPLLPCKDGYVSLNVRHDATWEYMWLFFEAPSVAHDERFSTSAGRREHGAEIEALLLPYLAKYTMEELFHGLAPLRLLIGMTMTIENLTEDSHLGERGFFETVPLPSGGETVAPGAPVGMSETPWSSGTAAPTLAEHNETVFCGRLGHSATEIERWRREGIV